MRSQKLSVDVDLDVDASKTYCSTCNDKVNPKANHFNSENKDAILGSIFEEIEAEKKLGDKLEARIKNIKQKIRDLDEKERQLAKVMRSTKQKMCAVKRENSIYQAALNTHKY